MNIFTHYFSKNVHNDDRKQLNITRDLLRREAEIGGSLFGPVPKGNKRQFFQLQKHTWVWVEQYTVDGQQRTKTTKYLMKPTELLKSVDGSHYERTSIQEARHFEKAVHLYVERVNSEMYSNSIVIA